jgi:hypothetical protein
MGEDRPNPPGQQDIPVATPSDVAVAASNSLADLAARIRAEHESISTALKDSVRHAISAGELLIEAKAQLGHGQWLPWLKDHCEIADRTARLYMRVAKNRAEIEIQIGNGVADLSLNETAALLMLSSDTRKLLNFVKQADGLSGEALIDFCVANDVAVVTTPDYDPFYGRGEAEKLEWLAFVLFLTHFAGWCPDGAWQHVEWLLQHSFQNVDELLGPTGDRWRNTIGMRHPSQQFRAEWPAFRDAHAGTTPADLEEELRGLKDRFDTDLAMKRVRSRRRRKAAP